MSVNYQSVDTESQVSAPSASPSRTPRRKVVVGVLLLLLVVAGAVFLLDSVLSGSPETSESSTGVNGVDVLQLVGKQAAYPGYTGSLTVSGGVNMVFFNDRVTFMWNNLEADPDCFSMGPKADTSNSCGIHFHEGTTCDADEDVGGHFFDDQHGHVSDPWEFDAFYTAPYGILNVEYGYSYHATEGRTFIIHDRDGTRVSCGLLLPQLYRTVHVHDSYPGYSGSLSPSGTVELDFQATQVTVHYDLSGVDSRCAGSPKPDTSNSCGVHIHEGTSCKDDELVSGHYYNEHSVHSDPWEFDAFYTAPTGSVVVEYGYEGRSSLGRAFVVHDFDGTRVTCDII